MTNFLTHLLAEWRSSTLIFKPSNLKLFVLLTLNTFKQTLLNRAYWGGIAVPIIVYVIGLFMHFKADTLTKLMFMMISWLFAVTITFVRPSMVQKNWRYLLRETPFAFVCIIMLYSIANTIQARVLKISFNWGAAVAHDFIIISFVCFIIFATFFFLDQIVVSTGVAHSWSLILSNNSQLLLRETLIAFIRGAYDALLLMLFQLPFIIITVIFFGTIGLCLAYFHATILWLFFILLCISWLSVLYIKKAHEDFSYYFSHKRYE